MAALDVEMLARNLIGGMEIQAFNREVREKRVAKFSGAIGKEQLDQLYGLSKLEALLKMEAIPITYVDLFDGGQLRRLADVQNKSGKTSFAVIADSLRKGATIRVRDADKFDAQLNQFVREIQRYLAASSQINVYLTPPSKTGFPPHFDTTDVFIVQCVGRKEWKIFHEYANKTELPLMETPWDADRFRPCAVSENITLSPGDVLYLPRGAMHEAFCTERESMHLTISIAALTFADLIGKALKAAAESDVAFRRRVPWSMDSGEGDYKELAAQARELAGKLADHIDVCALVKRERDAFGAEPEADGLGALTSALQGRTEKAGA
jgi:cupin superfamily protein